MRDVYVNANDFGLKNGDTITITLHDHIGNRCKNPTFKEAISSLGGEYQISLLENDVLCKNTYYTLGLPDGTMYPFKIFSSPYAKNPLDLKALIATGCFKGVVDKYEKTISSEYIKKFERFLIGKNPHFKPSENALTCKYINYANTSHRHKKSTDDVALMMDRYIGQIGVSIHGKK